MDAIYERLELYAVIAIGVVAFSMLVSYVLSVFIQKNISMSILSLVHTAEVVSDQKDYTIRAVKYDNDEIGVLTNTFNNMLYEIEKQNHEITSFNQNLEAEVRSRTRELEAAYEEMEAFSYTVSHDLNAPLRKIDTFVEAYLHRSINVIDEDGRKTFERIVANTGKMRVLISDLLSFSQLGKKELVKTMVNMKELAWNLFEEHKKLEEARVIEFNLCDIPNAFVDAMTINQVWVNLISNALKYTRKKEVTRIDVCFTENENSTTYYIKDNGAGFDMKDYNKLFSAFHRLHGDREFQGTGVGLAIVHRIVAKHGGNVWAEAVPDNGATFYFSIPKP